MLPRKNHRGGMFLSADLEKHNSGLAHKPTALIRSQCIGCFTIITIITIVIANIIVIIGDLPTHQIYRKIGQKDNFDNTVILFYNLDNWERAVFLYLPCFFFGFVEKAFLCSNYAEGQTGPYNCA